MGWIHYFDEADAVQYGLNQAIMLSEIRQWLRKNAIEDFHLPVGADGVCPVGQMTNAPGGEPIPSSPPSPPPSLRPPVDGAPSLFPSPEPGGERSSRGEGKWRRVVSDLYYALYAERRKGAKPRWSWA